MHFDEYFWHFLVDNISTINQFKKNQMCVSKKGKFYLCSIHNFTSINITFLYKDIDYVEKKTFLFIRVVCMADTRAEILHSNPDSELSLSFTVGQRETKKKRIKYLIMLHFCWKAVHSISVDGTLTSATWIYKDVQNFIFDIIIVWLLCVTNARTQPI